MSKMHDIWSEGREAIGGGVLQKAIDIGVFIIILTIPLSFGLQISSQTLFLQSHFSVPDVFIGIVCILYFFKMLFYKEAGKIGWPPTPVLAFVGAVCLSVVNAADLKTSIQDVFQFTTHFIFLYVIFINSIKTIEQIRRIRDVLFGLTTVIVLIASYQYFVLHGSPALIRSLFDNRNVLGGYLAIVLPLLYEEALFTKNLRRRIWLYLTIGLAMTVVLSPGCLIALVASFGIMSFLKGKKTGIAFGIVLLFGAAAYLLMLPKKNKEAIREFASIHEWGDINLRYNQVHRVMHSWEKAIVEKEIGEYNLIVSTHFLKSSVLPNSRWDPVKFSDMKGEKHINQRYVKWQGALNMLESNSLIGIGIGNYHSSLEDYAGELPCVIVMERYSSNALLAIAAETGLLGLASFLWLLAAFAKSALRTFRTYGERGRSLGLLGSLIGFLIAIVFSSLLIRGLLVLVVLVWSMIEVNERILSNSTAENPQKDKSARLLPPLRIPPRSLRIPRHSFHVGQRLMRPPMAAIFGLFCAVFSLVGSVEKHEKNMTVIEAEDAEEVTLPFQVITDPDASGGRCAQAPLEADPLGGMTYFIDIAKRGRYAFWGRMAAGDSCHDSFWVIVDGMKRRRHVLATDYEDGQWRWIRAGTFPLESGPHEIAILNREAGPKIDQFLLTTDRSYRPEGIESKPMLRMLP